MEKAGTIMRECEGRNLVEVHRYSLRLLRGLGELNTRCRRSVAAYGEGEREERMPTSVAILPVATVPLMKATNLGEAAGSAECKSSQVSVS